MHSNTSLRPQTWGQSLFDHESSTKNVLKNIINWYEIKVLSYYVNIVRQIAAVNYPPLPRTVTLKTFN